MRNEAAARRPNHDGPTEAHPASGRRMKAARADGTNIGKGVGKGAELGLALTDALEHILQDEQRTA